MVPVRFSVAAKRQTSHIFERATLNYIDWFNNRRIVHSLDYVPPLKFEAHYYV